MLSWLRLFSFGNKSHVLNLAIVPGTVNLIGTKLAHQARAADARGILYFFRGKNRTSRARDAAARV
jgi:hypothetical protein